MSGKLRDCNCANKTHTPPFPSDVRAAAGSSDVGAFDVASGAGISRCDACDYSESPHSRCAFDSFPLSIGESRHQKLLAISVTTLTSLHHRIKCRACDSDALV